MVRRLVERREVVVVELDLGALGDPVAQAEEDLDDLGGDLLDEVPRADRMRAARERHVDRLGADAGVHGRRRQLGAARLERCLERLADLVGHLADGRPLLGGERAEPAQDRGQRALLAEKLDSRRRRETPRSVSRDHGRKTAVAQFAAALR